MAKLAFMSFALLQAPYHHPPMQGFIERVEANFAVLEASDGFIDRSRVDEATGKETWGIEVFPTLFLGEEYAERRPQTLSLWQDLESVFAFAYSGIHAEALSKRKEWFVKPEWPNYVAWWVSDDHIPTWKEACERYDKLHQAGSSPDAFDFKQPFGSDGQPMRLDRELIKSKIAKNTQTSKKGTLTSMEIDVLVTNYIAAWSEPDTLRRQQILELVWLEDGCYSDPLTQAANRAELDQIIAGFLNKNPNAKFTLKDKVDYHHGCVRFYWSLHFANGSEVSGMDYGEVTIEGKLSKIVGFFSED